jgi:hypothetical protein
MPDVQEERVVPSREDMVIDSETTSYSKGVVIPIVFISQEQ